MEDPLSEIVHRTGMTAGRSGSTVTKGSGASIRRAGVHSGVDVALVEVWVGTVELKAFEVTDMAFD